MRALMQAELVLACCDRETAQACRVFSGAPCKEQCCLCLWLAQPAQRSLSRARNSNAYQILGCLQALQPASTCTAALTAELIVRELCDSVWKAPGTDYTLCYLMSSQALSMGSCLA